MTATEILQLLSGVRSVGDNKWEARCPAHDDRDPSLSVGVGDEQKVILNCHAGCRYEEVLRALNLEPCDLFPENDTKTRRTGRREVAVYGYTDKEGVLLYEVVRFDPKDFRQRRPDGAGGRIWNLKGVTLVPYGLPQLQMKPLVYIVEGEKDVALLTDMGLTATTNAGGAGKWSDSLTAKLAEAQVRSVVVLPDNDDAGRRHGEQVARSCHAAGLQVKLVELPGLPQKGDVSDWFSRDHTKADLEELATATHQYRPLSSEKVAPYKLLVRTPAEIAAMTPDKPEFLAPYIVKGSLTELTGYAKKGKTSLLAYVVGCIVHGEDCLEQPTRETGVLWLTEERLPTFRATLSRAGLLLAPRLHVCSRWDIPPSMTWPQIVANAVLECQSSSCELLVIDTLPAWAGLTGDKENNAGDALEALEPLQRAAQAGLAVVIVRHDRKGGGEVGTSGRGSSAFAGAMDTLLALKQPEGQGHPNQRVLTAVSRFDDVPLSLVVERLDPNAYSPHPTGSRFNKHFYRPLGAPGLPATHAVAQAIVDAAHEWMTTQELVAALPIFGKGVIANLLREMHPAQLDRVGAGKKGDPYSYKRRAEVDLSYSTSIPTEKENKHFPEAPADGMF